VETSKVNQFLFGLKKHRQQSFSQIRPPLFELCQSPTHKQT